MELKGTMVPRGKRIVSVCTINFLQRPWIGTGSEEPVANCGAELTSFSGLFSRQEISTWLDGLLLQRKQGRDVCGKIEILVPEAKRFIPGQDEMRNFIRGIASRMARAYAS